LFGDVSVDFRKEGGVLTNKDVSDTPASITSGNPETYALVDGQTLIVEVDGGAPQIATFNIADFGDINNATAAEIAAVILTDILGVTAADVAGSVVITSATAGLLSSVQVTGGTANAALGFSTSLIVGTQPFVEIGNGTYTIAFSASELDTLGSLTVTVNGATIQQSVTIANVVEPCVTSPSTTLETCTLFGTVLSPDGKPVAGAGVSARILSLPTIANGVGLSTSVVTATTDANGAFYLSVVQLAFVEVFIPAMNYRRQLTVPAQTSANLFTGVP
jgi:hypothetical protein